jgi:CO dehydrogenase/acetyl-CoA synthase beta subunit
MANKHLKQYKPKNKYLNKILNLKTPELRRKCNGQIIHIEKNVGEWREGVKSMTGVREGRKERLRDEDMEEIISCSLSSSLYCYQVCQCVMIRESHTHAYRDPNA